MIFHSANVKAVKADLAKGQISLTFVVPLEDQEKAERLAVYCGKEGSDLELDVSPRQPTLFSDEAVPTVEAEPVMPDVPIDPALLPSGLPEQPHLPGECLTDIAPEVQP